MNNINKLITSTKDIDIAALANPHLKEQDVIEIWDEVSTYIEKFMLQLKGVIIQGFGTFTFIQKKIDIGNNKYLLTQRPIFAISEKFAQTHALKYTKYPVAGHIPVHPLNYSAIANETIHKRDDVESCIRHVLQVFNRSIVSRKNVEFTFTNIGKLQIRDSKVKMRFFKSFVNLCDGTGRVIDEMQNRPHTLDSVLSRNDVERPVSKNTCILPRLNSRAGLDNNDNNLNNKPMHTINEESIEEKNQKHVDANDEEAKHLAPIASLFSSEDGFTHNLDKPTAEDTMRTTETQFRIPDAFSAPTDQSSFKSMSTSDLKKNDDASLEKPSSKKFIGLLAQRPTMNFVETPPKSSPSPCGHNSGQELCYLCHQKAKRNTPVYLDKERKQKEAEEESLLVDYQNLMDLEKRVQDETKQNLRRIDRAKMDHFNLEVAEAIKNNRKLERANTEIPRSFVFRRRLRTPPKFIKHQDYSEQLNKQLESKHRDEANLKKEREYIEKLEQVKLAEDLALQREIYLRDKFEKQNNLKTALDYQVQNKPLQLPKAEPENEYIGKNDMNQEKWIAKQMHNREIAKVQKNQIEERKRDDLLRQIREQEEDAENIIRDKHELVLDRTRKFIRATNARKNLENEWFDATLNKRERDDEEKQHRLAADGLAIHEQCDKYKRCTQCKRKLNNLGESNVWGETRYVPGCRIMV